jgi:hypothetical protein
MPIEGWLMLDKTTMKFSHVKPGDTDFKGEGLRDFFFYRDLGIAEATAGKVLAQLVRSNNAPEKGTGWHYHGADFHVVYGSDDAATTMTAMTERGTGSELHVQFVDFLGLELGRRGPFDHLRHG